jgi:hypothetical protein
VRCTSRPEGLWIATRCSSRKRTGSTRDCRR